MTAWVHQEAQVNMVNVDQMRIHKQQQTQLLQGMMQRQNEFGRELERDKKKAKRLKQSEGMSGTLVNGPRWTNSCVTELGA